ncbi:Zn finger protein HypA/HybF involved in hydrogenase expression [Bradyrhizobium sp. USDA 3256]
MINCIDCRKEVKVDAVRGMCQACYARDLRARNRIKFLVCQTCKGGFSSTRSDALFCSAACRQSAYRMRSECA